MSINELSAILEPPARAVATVGDWAVVERQLGTSLPDDYKQFINTYGTVYIDKFLTVFNPFSSNPNINLTEQTRVRLDALRELRDVFGEDVPYKLFPEAGGLLPFAATDNGDVLFWQTQGPPNGWTVVVNEARGPEYEEFADDLTSFLAKLLGRTITCRLFPQSFPSSVPTAEPSLPG